jgi:hypothetical protein
MMMFSSAAKAAALRRPDGQLAPERPFAEIVVGVSLDGHGDARGAESEKTLTGAAGRVDDDGVVGQPGLAVAAGDFVAEAGAQGSLDIGDRQVGWLRAVPLQEPAGLFDEVVVRRIVRMRPSVPWGCTAAGCAAVVRTDAGSGSDPGPGPSSDHRA